MIKTLSIYDVPQEKENILELENPNQYQCRVHTYIQSHSMLLVQLLDKKNIEEFNPLYISFSAVDYFEGFIGWTGANLCIKSYDNFKFPVEELESVNLKVNLFTFLANNTLIRIRASSLDVSNTIPTTFHLLHT